MESGTESPSRSSAWRSRTGEAPVVSFAAGFADEQAALAKYNKIMAAQYAAGVQDFKGAGRITQQELKQDLPSQSTMANRAQSAADFRTGVQEYIQKMKEKRAQLFGMAGQLASPDLSEEDFGKVNEIYRPGGDLYVPAQPTRKAGTTRIPKYNPATGQIE